MSADKNAPSTGRRLFYEVTRPLFGGVDPAPLHRLVTGGRATDQPSPERDVIRTSTLHVGQQPSDGHASERHTAVVAEAVTTTRIPSDAAHAYVAELLESALASFEQRIARRLDRERQTSSENAVTPAVHTSSSSSRRAGAAAPAQLEEISDARVRAAPAPTKKPIATSAPTPAPKLSAGSPLFRAEALAAYARGERLASVLRVTSVSYSTMLALLGGALAVALAVIGLAKVEERSAARGVLRTPFGLAPVLPLINGRVREVLAEPGANVEAGQLLVVLDTTPIEAQRAEASQRLAAVKAQWHSQSESLRAHHAHAQELGQARIALLAARQAAQRRRIARSHEQVQRIQAPELDAVVERSARDQSEEMLDRAREDLLRTSDELSALQLQLGSARGAFEQEVAAGEARVREAEGTLEATEILLRQAQLHAPITGKLESLRVHPGQTVQTGEWVARIVRDDTPRTIISFVPERDAAFLHPGAPAQIEIDKLPAGEFGFANATITHVGGELADPSEIVAALGQGALEGPHRRVELELDESPQTERVRPFVRAGTLVTARIALRDRRLLAIVFEPVRKWLE